MRLVFFSSAFCDPCIQTRHVLSEAAALVPRISVTELDVVRDQRHAQEAGIRSTPTVLILDDADSEIFRAEGVPTLNQVLVAVAHAL